MAKDKTHFIARGKSLEIIKDYHAKVLAHVEHTNAMSKRLGSDGPFRYSDHRLAGFSFELNAELPEGLRRSKDNKKMAIPDRRTKAGRALQKEIEEHRIPDHWTITHQLMDGPVTLEPNPYGTGMIMGMVSFEQVGDEIIIGVPHKEGNEPVTPPDAERIKKSDYWARKEAAEAAAAP